VNEIVEIGAVKLDENFNEIDRFSQIVRSAITKRLSTRFRELTGITNEQMQQGILFEDALCSYKAWAGDDSITLTWSNSDLHTLYHNCINFIGDYNAAKIGKYVDLQKYFQYELSLNGEPQKNQISLSNAAILFGINFEADSLHRALDDSYIAASILKKCYVKKHFDSFVIDTNNDDFYKKMMYKVHYLSDMSDSAIDKSKLNINCPKCKKQAKRIAGWKNIKPWFHSFFLCEECNLKFKGAIALKKFFDRVEVKSRIFESSVKPAYQRKNIVVEKTKKTVIKQKSN
jgi:inhibitor of KinA sporulation pathway (predicted exonuclease)